MPESKIGACPTAITTIPTVSCREIFGKAAKLIFQRAVSGNYFDETATETIDDADDWSGLFDAADDTKCVITPEIENVVFGEQEQFTNGENIHGAPIEIALGAQPITIQIRNGSPSEKAALSALRREDKLWVYVLDAGGNFLANLVSGSVGTDGVVSGINLSPRTFQVKDPTREGTQADEFMINLNFSLVPNWYDTAFFQAPEAGFNPLDLAPS